MLNYLPPDYFNPSLAISLKTTCPGFRWIKGLISFFFSPLNPITYFIQRPPNKSLNIFWFQKLLNCPSVAVRETHICACVYFKSKASIVSVKFFYNLLHIQQTHRASRCSYSIVEINSVKMMNPDQLLCDLSHATFTPVLRLIWSLIRMFWSGGCIVSLQRAPSEQTCI